MNRSSERRSEVAEPSRVNARAPDSLTDNVGSNWDNLSLLDEIDLDGLSTWFPQGPIVSPVHSMPGQQTQQFEFDSERDHNLSTDAVTPSTSPAFPQEGDCPWSEYQPMKSLVSVELSLVEYYFHHVAAMYSCFDGSMNPFRTTVGRVWASSQVLTWTLQSMAAACLVRDFPHLASQGMELRSQALQAIEEEAASGRTTEMSLLSVIMLGQSASWHLQADVGLSQYRLAKRIMASGQRRNRPEDARLPGRNSMFFQQSLHYWEMLLSFVTGLDDPTDSPGDPQVSILPLQMIPHPWAMVASDLMERIHEVGRLVYKHRRNALGSKFWRRTDLTALQCMIQDVAPLEVYLLNYQLPAHEHIVDPGDEMTPVSHFVSVAEAYRLVALLQIYRVFPDILEERLTSEVPAPALVGIPKPSLNSAEQWIKALAMHTVGILRRVPFESHTRSVQAFLLVALSSEMQYPMSPDRIENVNGEMLEITEARKFIRGRLEAYRFVFAPQPAQRKLDIVMKVWEQLDGGHSGVCWMDVMIENGWEVLFC